MRFSEKWLREWVNPQLSSAELAETLTMAGLEVDEVEPVAGEFSGVVVARIEHCEPHPDADKLRLCQVNDGGGELVQIVCGAPNARVGLVAPLAQIGGVLPGNFKIKKAKLRGVESFGMLCSGKELGLGDDHGGLLELPGDAEPGIELRNYLDLDDVSIEVDLTPNRADCLGLIGIAQDVAALTGASQTVPSIDPVSAQIDREFPVELVDQRDCPRYLGRVIEGINPTAATPLWMQEKLRRSGLRPISPVVDVTNYVLLELGQPMHAFDLDKLNGGIRVQRAQNGQKIALLDESEQTLTDELLICDHQGPVAIGGIMGGLGSSVTDETRNIFLECAWFRPQTIAGRARELGMHTDSSHRYERGVDPLLQPQAMERATALLTAIVGGKPGPVTEAVSEADLPQPMPVALRHQQVARLLGVELSKAQIEDILQALGMSTERTDDGWTVVAPSRRMDISEEVDLIEEIARVYGYNNLPQRQPQGTVPAPVLPEADVELSRLQSVLVERGYSEAINYSFVAPATLKPLGDDQIAVELSNPLSAEMKLMRTALVPGLLATASYNQKRQRSRIRLFESGTVFPQADREEQRIGGVVTGGVLAEQWAASDRAVDFFDIKGDVEALLSTIGDEFSFRPSERGELHPGQSADIFRGEVAIGWVGALHPAWQKKADLNGAVFGFELSLDAISSRSVPKFEEVSKFPSSRVDLAFEVPRTTSWAAVREIVEQNAGNLLTQLIVFDEYTGQGIAADKKSLAFGLVLQDTTRTLTDEQAEQITKTVVTAMGEQLGATLRG